MHAMTEHGTAWASAPDKDESHHDDGIIYEQHPFLSASSLHIRLAVRNYAKGRLGILQKAPK